MSSDKGNSSSRSQNAYRCGMRQYHRRRYDRAVKALAKAEQEGGLTAMMARYYGALSHRAIGVQAMQAGRFDEAESHLRTAAERLGGDGDLTGFLARVYARTGRFSDCSRKTDKALSAKKNDAAAWLAHAQAQWRNGRREDAQITLRSALRQCGNDARLLMQMGLFLGGEGQWAEARERFFEATQADCADPDAHYYHALAAAATGDACQAVRSLQRAFELRPNDLILAHRLSLAAKAAALQGQEVPIRLPEDRAARDGSQMAQLAAYITSEVDFVDAFLSLPPSEVDGELFGVLAGALETALAEHPRYADLHHRASAVYRRLARADKALEHATAAVEINGRYVQARLNLARLYADSDNSAEALEHAERTIASGGDWPDAHCLAGELLMRLGRKADARRHLERALELNGNYSRAAEALASLAA